MPCAPPGRALRDFWRRVGEHRESAPPHRLGLIGQRDAGAGRARVALCVVRTVVADRIHVDREDLAVFLKPILVRARMPGRARPMKCSSSRVIRIITGALAFFFFRQQCR